jgi:hypothetical protein
VNNLVIIVYLVVPIDLEFQLVLVSLDTTNILNLHMNVSLVLIHVLNVILHHGIVLNVLPTELLYQTVTVQMDISMNKLLLVLHVELNVLLVLL